MAINSKKIKKKQMIKHVEETEQEWKAKQKRPQSDLPLKKREVSKKPKKGVQTGLEPPAKPKVTSKPSKIIELDMSEPISKENLNAEKPKFQEPKKRKKTVTPKATNKEGKKFRVNAKKCFITVPQYKGNLTPLKAMQKLKDFCAEKGKKVTRAIVCLEKHGQDKNGKGIEKEEDPGVHFHLAFEVNKEWNITNPKYFDDLFMKHVHVESCNDFQHVVAYCAKEGNFVTHNLDVDAIKEALKTKKGVKHIEVAKKILEDPNKPIEEYVNEFPGYFIQHQKKVIDFISLAQTINCEVEPYYGLNDYSKKNSQTKQVCEWLENNLWPNKRQPRQKQLYIYGPTAIGKTTILSRLQDSFATYLVAEEANAAFWTDFHDNFELAIFDEFNGCKTIHQMNAFVEGNRVKLAGKGIGGVVKKRNIPIIVCSNKSPQEVYHNVAEKSPATMKAFMDRFVIVDCNNFEEGKDFLDIPWKTQEDLIKESTEVISNPPETNVIDLLKSNSVLILPEDEYHCEQTELVEEEDPKYELKRTNQFNAWYDQRQVNQDSSEDLSDEDHSQWSLEHNHN